MLSKLRIQNYILIKELEIDFHDKLTTITGETGAGKSIILGALGLILGSSADASSLLDETKKCAIEGAFNIQNYDLKSFFDKHELDWEEETILRREIAPGGKSRAFINDTPVTISILKELGEKLVDIHSQHQTLRLIGTGFQISLLDANIDHKDLLEEYKSVFRSWRKLNKGLSELKETESRTKKEYDYNLFQLNEIDDIQLQHGELAKLEDELSVLSHAETIQTNLQHSSFLLSDDEQSILNKLREIKKMLSGISSYNARLRGIAERIDGVLIEGKDLSGEMEDFLDSVSVDNERMETVSQRLQIINNLLNKHQLKTEVELVNYADELRSKVSRVESITEDIQRLEKEQEKLLKRANELAVSISNNRKKEIPSLEKNLVSLLKQVGIPEARVVIQIDDSEALNEFGKDHINILFSANKGAKPDTIDNVASGGELSRMMLCFKYILADSIFLPTIIFDEIDTGISGEVAISVGKMIKKMASRHQVLCITHLPQMAAMGNHHFFVYKKSGKDFTQTFIRELQPDERIDEIAKMLSGNKPSTTAVENAKELLGSVLNI